MIYWKCRLSSRQSQAVAAFLIDIVKIIAAVFIIGGLVPGSRITRAHFVISILCSGTLFTAAMLLIKGEK